SSHEYLLVEKKGEKGCVGLVTLNRPKALNALCEPMMVEMASVLRDLDNDPTVAAMVITGGEKAFVAGGDIKFMVTQQFSDFLRPNFLVQWNGITQLRKPTIAAVNGFALGGGCELAMMCDIILAGEKAK
ncbi:putative enoyl-CoA hydratase, mitochondrial, partial [Halocaridina rubra]